MNVYRRFETIMGCKSQPCVSRTHYIRFGTENGDFGLIVDFHRKRSIVKANVALILGGVALEDITHESPQYAPAVVLVKGTWNKIYFLNKRATWTEDNYFDYANKLMHKQGITKP